MCLSSFHGGFSPELGGVIVVGVYPVNGEYDYRLVPWPFRGSITVQVVNLINDQKHQEHKFTSEDNSSIFSSSKKTSGEKEISKNEVAIVLNPREQYIKDDCVRLRVTSIEVEK